MSSLLQSEGCSFRRNNIIISKKKNISAFRLGFYFYFCLWRNKISALLRTCLLPELGSWKVWYPLILVSGANAALWVFRLLEQLWFCVVSLFCSSFLTFVLISNKSRFLRRLKRSLTCTESWRDGVTCREVIWNVITKNKCISIHSKA